MAKLLTKALDFLSKEEGYYQIEFPCSRMVCPSCDGEGTELRGGLKGAVFTSEDFAEDPEFAENYFGGRYDVACSECKGRNVVDDLNVEELWDKLTPQQQEDRQRYCDDESAAREEEYGERIRGA